MEAERRRGLSQAIVEAGPALRRFVRRQVRDLGDAEDIVQEALLEFASVYGLAQPIEQVAAWLARVARRRIIDRYRSRARAARRFVDVTAQGDEPQRVMESWQAPAAEGPEGQYIRERFLAAFSAALQSLPSEQREVFVAHEFDGQSFKALAAATGTPLNTLLGRKHAAIKSLREQLAPFQSLLDVTTENLP